MKCSSEAVARTIKFLHAAGYSRNRKENIYQSIKLKILIWYQENLYLVFLAVDSPIYHFLLPAHDVLTFLVRRQLTVHVPFSLFLSLTLYFHFDYFLISTSRLLLSYIKISLLVDPSAYPGNPAILH